MAYVYKNRAPPRHGVMYTCTTTAVILSSVSLPELTHDASEGGPVDKDEDVVRITMPYF